MFSCRGDPFADAVHTAGTTARVLLPRTEVFAMAKNPDERIEILERKVNLYRVLLTLMVLLFLVAQRQRVVGWIDGMEKWFSKAADVRS